MQETISIGRLAELSGLPIKRSASTRTSDCSTRPSEPRPVTAGSTKTTLARLQLIRSLRDLGLDLPTIRSVLDGHGALPERHRSPRRALETRIRGLQRQLACCARRPRSPSEDTVRRVHQLARLDAAERRQLLDTFWDRALEGVPIDPETAARFRAMGSPDAAGRADAPSSSMPGSSWPSSRPTRTSRRRPAATPMWAPAAA